MKKTKSIVFRLVLIFITLSTILFAGIWVSNNANNEIRKEYKQYLQKNTELSMLPVKVNELATKFDVTTRNRSEEAINDMQLLNEEITSILESVQQDVQNDRDSLMHFRALVNMHNYQQIKVNEILTAQEFDVESYNDVVYVKNLYIYMNSSSQSLMMAFQKYSSNSYAEIMEEIRVNEENINLVLIFFGFLSIILAFLLTKDIFKTLRELSSTAKRLSDGDWHINDIQQNHYKELNNVTHAFNKMKEYIQLYIEQLNNKAEIELQLQKQKLLTIEKEKLLKESQLLNLQMQMNPHFLFNTLNMIGRTAMFEDNQTTVKLIEAISIMLRFNLENNGKIVPLKDELNALQAYIFIQGMRFQERIRIELDEEADIDSFLIPPLSLQPIVENCLIHGLQDIQSGGEIKIKVNVKDDMANIVIQDNGKGIEKSKVEQLFLANTEGESLNGTRKSIGLENVKKRLELTFNKENLLQITSTVNQGTVVQINLPKEVG